MYTVSYTTRDVVRASCKQTRRSLAACFLVVITKGGNTFGASLPDMPGCVALSSDLNKVKELIKEGVVLHLKGTLEHKYQLPDARTTTFEEDMDPDEELTEASLLSVGVALAG